MAAWDFSVTQLEEAIPKAKKVYDTFCQDYENAPTRIRELSDTVNYLWKILITLKIHLQPLGTHFHGKVTFAQKLQACEVFITEYSVLRIVNLVDGISEEHAVVQVHRRIWITTKQSFDDNSIRLEEGLSQELYQLNDFILKFFL
jgi:hypothetical protein